MVVEASRLLKEFIKIIQSSFCEAQVCIKINFSPSSLYGIQR